ncbi:MAG: GlsB/YeaQ/YmgE family stress response membrane protein [Burkholderiales bacterium]
MLVEILLTLVVGLIVGVIARFVMPGAQPMGWIATILLGIGGAFVGGIGGQALGLYRIGEPVGWIGAVLGAVILLLIYRMIKRAA